MTSLAEQVQQRFADQLQNSFVASDGVLTLETSPEYLFPIACALYEETVFNFNCLIDLCGVDYLDYGVSEWRTEQTTSSGFSRGRSQQFNRQTKSRFAVVYQLLSIEKNQRLRLRVWLCNDNPKVSSVFPIWNAANWFEREAYDLFGIEFVNHPDLRRILTDYGFKGHPFRKDFPLSGEVELRYDAAKKTCVYEPVSIQPRVGVPKVIRHDSRYRDIEK